MPVKRRVPKGKIGPAAELAAWSELFETGYDFFGDLEPLGFNGSSDADRASRAAAKEAWERLGGLFMQTWQPEPNGRQKPWAFEEYGEPGKPNAS